MPHPDDGRGVAASSDPPPAAMKIRHRVGFGVAVLVALMAGLAAFAGVHYTRLSGSVKDLFDRDFRVSRAAENLIKESERLELARLRVVEGDRSGHPAFREHAAQFGAWYDEVDALTFSDPDTALVDSIKSTFNLYLTQSAGFFRAASATPGDLNPERDAVRLQGRAAAAQSAELGRQLFLLLERYQTAMDRSSRTIQRSAKVGAALVWSAAGVAVLVTLLVGLQFARSIIAPIERLTRTVRSVGLGRLGRTVDIRSRDEMGTLGREFNRMTERLAAFEAMNVQTLVAEKRKTESLVETMPSPVFVTDMRRGRLLLVNAAALDLLASASATAPVLWRDQTLADVLPEGPLRACLSAPVALPGEATSAPSGDGAPSPEAASADDEAVFSLGSEGEERFFRARHRIVATEAPSLDPQQTDPDDAGADVLRITLLEDVTHFKRLDQLKTDFIAAVSHELRTPLMSIGMAVDLLREGAGGEVTALQDDLLGSVKDDQARLKRLVNGLLSLARIESGIYTPAREPLRMADVVEEALAPLRLPFREHDIDLDVDVAVTLPRLDGDAQHLGWVVSNLVGNALKHTPPGGRVTVRALHEDGGGAATGRAEEDRAVKVTGAPVEVLRLDVSDTGVGIPADALDSIFGAFVQVKDRNLATPGSVGLGLHLAQRVVHAHGGRIWADSVVGAGTTFHVELPLHPSPVDASPHARAPHVGGRHVG